MKKKIQISLITITLCLLGMPLPSFAKKSEPQPANQTDQTSEEKQKGEQLKQLNQYGKHVPPFLQVVQQESALSTVRNIARNYFDFAVPSYVAVTLGLLSYQLANERTSNVFGKSFAGWWNSADTRRSYKAILLFSLMYAVLHSLYFSIKTPVKKFLKNNERRLLVNFIYEWRSKHREKTREELWPLFDALHASFEKHGENYFLEKTNYYGAIVLIERLYSDVYAHKKKEFRKKYSRPSLLSFFKRKKRMKKEIVEEKEKGPDA